MSLPSTLQTVIHDVSKFETLLPVIVTGLEQSVKCFKAGNLTSFLSNWRTITSDSEILDMITGTTIDFKYLPVQHGPPAIRAFSDTESQIIGTEIEKLLNKGVIVRTDRETGDFISPLFLREKKDGSHRMILNLKALNESIVYHHFKMDTLGSVIKLMRPNCFMATIDLKDAYYSVPVSEKHQKYLKFHWKGNFYKFTCFPNGLCFCPRKFTKLIKPVHSRLRLQGHILAAYIDDNYTQGDTYTECLTTVLETLKLFVDLGFCAHPEKSCLIPSQEVIFLGVVLNSITMTVRLTIEKKQKIKNACTAMQERSKYTIREVASVLGLLVSSFPAVMYGPLYYRQLEREKSHAIKDNNGNYEAFMSLSPDAKTELQWWIENIENSFNVISHDPPSLTISTDASKIGWGGVFNDMTCGGHWSPQEAEEHINYLELMAAFFSLQAFVTTLNNKHVRLKIDNTTAVAAINNMGTNHSVKCNKVASDIWSWCMAQNIWISAEHIAGKCNKAADRQSREINTNTEWMLNPTLLNKALDKLPARPDIDMFASRLNKQFPRYISYRPDPGAYLVDAFSAQWNELNGYYFPPFSVIPKVLQKLEQDKATGVVVIPRWPTQVWYSMAMRMLISCPVLLQHSARLRALPSHPKRVHPLHKKLDLLICHLSGNSCMQAAFHKQLQISSCVPGEMGPKSSTGHIFPSGKLTATPKGSVQFQLL